MISGDCLLTRAKAQRRQARLEPARGGLQEAGHRRYHPARRSASLTASAMVFASTRPRLVALLRRRTSRATAKPQLGAWKACRTASRHPAEPLGSPRDWWALAKMP